MTKKTDERPFAAFEKALQEFKAAIERFAERLKELDKPKKDK